MSATDELRRLLDERGVEWEAFDDFEPTTQWSTHNGAFVYWARERDGKLLVETTAPFKCSISCTHEQAIEACTPEQAVEATLGREPDDAAMVKLHDRMNVALLECERKLGIEKADGTIVVPFVFEMHNLLEEAAMLGLCNCTNDCTNGERTGTCIADETETISVRGDTWGYYFDKHFTIHVMECSECGHTYEHVNGDYEFCPHCGRRVVEVDA